MVHDLQVYQAELEAQNETLRGSQIQLAQSRDRFIDFYECSPVAYMTLSNRGIILDINMTGATLLQMERVNITGRPFARFLVLEDRAYWHLNFVRLLEQEERLDCELTLVRSDGSRRNIRLDCLPLVRAGQARSIRAVLTDITERKQAQMALQESEDRYRTLIEWTPEPVIVSRAQILIYLNPAAVKLFGGRSALDLIGKKTTDLAHPDSLDSVRVRQRYFDEHGFTPRAEQKLIQLDGTPIYVEIQSTRIVYDGAPAVHATLRDITERRAIEAELKAARVKAEKASQAKSQFLASASHDLRQPAHALGMFVARLAELPHDAPTAQLVAGMDASVRAMQDMLDGFLDISRLDSESTKLRMVAFPIDRLFGQLRASLAAAASDKGVRLRLRPSRAWVRSEPALVYRILLNLVSNALRYTLHGTVLVACRPTRDGQHLRIEVRDSGIGIAPEHHEAVFQEFFQVDNPERNRAKGQGVGLSIVKHACRILNLPLSMRSALGCGTCFSVMLPLAQVEAVGTQDLLVDLPSGGNLAGLRVLVIEDDPLGRESLALLLQTWGCQVSLADGAHSACELCRKEESVDVIISDFRLGDGIDGIQAVRRVREVSGRQIAACLITGDVDAGLRSQAQEAGLALLYKPVRPAKLRNLLRHMVQVRAAGPSAGDPDHPS